LALGAAIFMASFIVVTFAELIRRRGVRLDSTSGI
jgi:hypothetical protein